MAEKLILTHVGAPLSISYESDMICLVYTGGKVDLQTIRADLKGRNLTPSGPLETAEQLSEIHQRVSERPNLFKIINTRPILIANDVDIWTPEKVFVGGNNLIEARTAVPLENVGEYISDLDELKENPYLKAKYTLAGIELLVELAKRKKKLANETCIHSPRILPGMTADNHLMNAHALSIPGDRFYFNNAFQSFSSCCVFGRVCPPSTYVPFQ